ncbi:DUF1109 domain-containing protein [Actimicrobium sp. CCC2.4]|uniref:DUF1109 domain-containing protein n=1 Tax=Actimicrobium sp. CCC2.4 TaxID=3048606 RepID=UPI002AC9B9E9|nr:DUF1109 domain-containing protein [Actimicrobium sp. CCC2.4]MEB0136214.1 DUF1109 domain-containing protein [Actimicrobium sp. CCC2.4]WPX33560.1 DUF1109 domain-containing protein [Actimicrobium sp. CCC2.4]
MKTDELINMLATGPDVSAQALPAWRNTLLMASAVLVSMSLMMILLGVRKDLIEVATQPAFLLKVAFVAALAWTGKIAVARLSLPGARTAMLPALIALPLVIMFVAAGLVLMDAAPGQRAQLFWGSTWRICAFLIAGLSLPIFAALLMAMRDLAPTRLRLAGAAAGFTAGATAATIYCLHCPEIEAPFVAFWYLLGMLIPAAIGALIGPRILRW